MMACHFSFNLIDSIWVGRLMGPAALAAVSTAGFSVWVVLNLGEMVEIGLIAVAARRHGEGDRERAARAAAAAVAYALLAGLAVSLAGLGLASAIFRLMTVPAEVARLGHAYLSTWLLGGPLVFGFFAIEATFRAAGDTRTPFLMLAGSVCVSILLDPLLIMGLGPFPRLEVEGAALASVMVRGGGFLLGLAIASRTITDPGSGLARPADDHPYRGAVVPRGSTALGDLHVAHPVHVAVRHSRARRAGRGS